MLIVVLIGLAFVPTVAALVVALRKASQATDEILWDVELGD